MTRISTYIILFIFSITPSFSQIESEDILIKNDSILLPGTLTYKKGMQQPLIIFVPGSGNPDRNGNQPSYNINPNYIKQLSDTITQHGIAFYRYDKRSATKENNKYLLKKYVFTDLVKDVSAIISYFKEDTRFNKIILIGHSQGSLVAMLAANKHIDKYISLSGLGEASDKTIIRQLTAQNPDAGKIAKKHIKELKSTGTIQEINPFLLALFAKQNHVFLISYFKFNPSEEIKKLTIPTLIINGDKDLQVPVEDAKILHKGNSKAQLVIIKNMNHVLKNIDKDTDNTSSYYSADFPVSAKLIETIITFVKE